ncbi:hypothetical protein R3P38DRAFT_2837915 [Favolaschia claudopus]|uniref:Uncharacterized protein n=1 Tax=Favolaschia claudopus TaxID=2862362 RepID=A0AAW0E3D3_9AGAR
MSVDSFNPDSTIGAFLIGVLVSYFLFGTMSHQAKIYFRRFPDDPFRLKALVAFVWISCFGHAICIGHALYVYTIKNFGHLERILEDPAPMSWETSIFFYGLVAASVQGFFSFRIYAFSKNLYISGFIWILIFCRFLTTISSFAGGLRMTALITFLRQYEWVATTGWSVGTAADVSITITLVILLAKGRDKAHKRCVSAQANDWTEPFPPSEPPQ